ncbi:MAG: gamma-glutamylcyclotransferase family protein [Candidatus Hodarchaeales archaeon]
MAKIFYFAYGANTDIEKLEDRGVSPSNGQLGWLEDYRITFNKEARGKKMGYANAEIKPGMGHKVYGVLWEIFAGDYEKLKRYEVGYRTKGVSVQVDCGWVASLMFVAEDDDIDYPRWPGLKYIRRIIKAGKKWNFSRDYMKILKRFEEKAWRPL